MFDRIRDAKIKWWHYLILFVAYCAGYWTAVWVGW